MTDLALTDLAFDPALNRLLNQFSVPMYAMDQPTPSDEFCYVCVNQAMELAGGKPAQEMLGLSVYQLLPKVEADTAHMRYVQCVEMQGDLRFRDQFTTAGHSVLWDTTLQHVSHEGGGDRIVATAIQISGEGGSSSTVPAFEDIQYFSSMADLQLQNLISTFEIFRGRDLFSIQNEQHIDRLTGMCRTVQRAVEDIKKAVHATAESVGVAPTLGRKLSKPAATPRVSRAGSDTVEALFSDVTEDLRRFSS